MAWTNNTYMNRRDRLMQDHREWAMRQWHAAFSADWDYEYMLIHLRAKLVTMKRYNLNLSYVVKGPYYAKQIHLAIKMIDIILVRGGQNDYDDGLGPDGTWPDPGSFKHQVNMRNRGRIPRANDGGECYWSDAQQLRFDKAWMLLWKILAERSILWGD